MKRLKHWAAAALAGLWLLNGSAVAEQKELRVGYQPNPLQNASLDMMERWGAKHDVKIVKIPNSYGVYVEKMTASLTSGSTQFDIIWHNDDWGQLWAHLLEPMDDVAGLKYVDPWGVEPAIFGNAQGKTTVVPMAHTFPVFFYRTDLVKESEVPRTWDELVKVSKKLQAEDKVKFGFVGGMSMNNTWFTWLWSMWTDNCDILLPARERDNAVLAKNGWKSGLNEPCMRQVAEFWWDALNVHKISPRGMPAYDRNEANAVFTSATLPSPWPTRATGTSSTIRPSRRSPARSASPNCRSGPKQGGRELQRDLGLGDPEIRRRRSQGAGQADAVGHDVDEAGQVALWKKTGAPPPNRDAVAEDRARRIAFMQQVKKYYARRADQGRTAPTTSRSGRPCTRRTPTR